MLSLSEEGLSLFRSLSETLRKTAKQREALFLDVEAILRRHLADAVSCLVVCLFIGALGRVDCKGHFAPITSR